MNDRIRSAMIIFAVAALGACATSQPGSSPTSKPPQGRILFPSAPAEPVVEWLASYGRRSDVDPGRKKLRRILVGEEEQEEGLLAPTAVAIGPDSTLYVVDQELHAVVLVNPAAKQFAIFHGRPGASLAEPVGVAVAEDGTLYVSDAVSRAVFAFDAELRLRSAFGGPEVFVRPTALALSTDGARLAVCDTHAHQVRILDTRDGSTRTVIGGSERGAREGEFNFPVAVTFDDQGYLYVSDYLNFRIQVFDPAGDPVLSFGQAGDRPGDLNRPRGLAVDAAAGVIYEVDGAFELVQMFNLDGELLMWFGSGGTATAQFSLPSGISRRGDLLAVADTLNRRVQLFRFLGRPRPTSR